jgi:hypothetical protein
MKSGRNELCRCGSGKKYKQCCMRDDEARERAEREQSHAQRQAEMEARHAAAASHLERYQQSTHSAESVMELIESGRLAEAEAAARAHIERFAESPVGFDLMGMLCEARGEALEAAQWYRRIIAFMRAHPEMFSAKDEVRFQRRLERLDPADVTA